MPGARPCRALGTEPGDGRRQRCAARGRRSRVLSAGDRRLIDNPPMRAAVTIQQADFDLSAEVAALREGDPQVGAIASFVGTVRDRNDGASVSAMELEHYPGMT